MNSQFINNSNDGYIERKFVIYLFISFLSIINNFSIYFGQEKIYDSEVRDTVECVQMDFIFRCSTRTQYTRVHLMLNDSRHYFGHRRRRIVKVHRICENNKMNHKFIAKVYYISENFYVSLYICTRFYFWGFLISIVLL